MYFSNFVSVSYEGPVHDAGRGEALGGGGEPRPGGSCVLFVRRGGASKDPTPIYHRFLLLPSHPTTTTIHGLRDRNHFSQQLVDMIKYDNLDKGVVNSGSVK